MRVLAGIVLALVFFAGLVFATLRETRAECEVCVAFEGDRVCRTSSASDEEEATRMAQSTACAALSNGVTAGMQCRRTPPLSVRCGG